MINFAIYEFDSNLYDFYPTMPEDFTYTHSDEVGSDGIVTRTLSCEDSELTKLTSIIFGASGNADRGKSLLNVTYVDTTNITDMSNMFRGCIGLTSLELSNFNTAKVTNMGSMFNSCAKLTSLDLSSFNTAEVINMDNMFNGCAALTSLDLSNFNTSKVITMLTMFYGCSQLTSLDLSSFNTINVTNMNGMFYGCSKLTSLDLSNFNTAKVPSMTSMFQNCSKLTSLDLRSFNVISVTNMNNMFNGCSELTSLDLSVFDILGVLAMNGMFKDCLKLSSIYMIGSFEDSINKIISVVPTRSEYSKGKLYVSDMVDIPLINVEGAKTKYWIVTNDTEPEPIDNNLIKNVFRQNDLVTKVSYGETDKVKNIYLFKVTGEE